MLMGRSLTSTRFGSVIFNLSGTENDQWKLIDNFPTATTASVSRLNVNLDGMVNANIQFSDTQQPLFNVFALFVNADLFYVPRS